MNALPHLLALLFATALAWPLMKRPAPRCPVRLQLLALGAAVLAATMPAPAWVFGKEGIAEALTEGLLLAIVIRAGGERQMLMALAALVLLAEELDYGQLLLGFETPEFLRVAGSRSGQLNYHNAGVAQALFRVVPAVFVFLLSTPRVYALAERLRLPTLHSSARPALLISIAASVLVGAMNANDRAADELVELLAVAVVANTWRLKTQTSDAASRSSDARAAGDGGDRSTTSSSAAP